MNAHIVVLVTVDSPEEGRCMADALVGEGLAACVNRVGSVQSTYRWKGQVERSEEQLLIIKTTADRFDAVRKKVEALHSYSVPEIIALPIQMGNQSYLNWLSEQVTREED